MLIPWTGALYRCWPFSDHYDGRFANREKRQRRGCLALTTYWLSTRMVMVKDGGLRADAVGGNALTANNAVGQAGGQIGYAAQFSAASSQSLSHTNNPSLSTGNIDFTLAAWVYLTDKSADRVIVSKWNKDNNQRDAFGSLLQYASAADRFNFGVSNDGTTIGSLNADALGAPATGTWYFVVAWHDSVYNTLNIQVNNGAVNSLAWSTGVLDGNASFEIGARNDSLPNYMDGRIDEVGLWKRVLTADERTSLYQSGAGCQYPFSPSCAELGGNVKYYYAGSQRVMMRDASGALYFLLGDHLGSTSKVADAGGAYSAELRYGPWGETVYSNGTPPTNFQFTGQRLESGIGLYYYGARWYDTALRRWMQADTIVPSAGNPQALNRYSYALSNPLKYTDPTGHCVDPGSTCIVKDGSSPATDDLLQYMLSLLDQRDQGKINDLQILDMFLSRAFELFSNPIDALRAATNVARPGGLPGIPGGQPLLPESPYVYSKHTDVRLGSTGFGDLADPNNGDQVSHFIGEAYASTIAEGAALNAHLPWASGLAGSAVPIVVELGRPGQPARTAATDADLGHIGYAMANDLSGSLVDPQQVLTTAMSDIVSYNYSTQHPNGAPLWSQALEWIGPIKQQLGFQQ